MKKNEIIQLEMYDMVVRWQNSGMKQKEFCRQEGISYYKFKYWKTHYTRNQDLNQQPQNYDNSHHFISLEVSNAENLFSGIELTFPNGVKLSISQRITTQEVKSLIKLY